MFHHIYAVVDGSNSVLVYDAPPSSATVSSKYVRLKDIVVKDMKDPSDMAAHPSAGMLYVSDWEGHCVWQIHVNPEVFETESNLPDEEKMGDCDHRAVAVKWAAEVGTPRAISVTCKGQVLLIDAVSCDLSIYSDAGEMIAVIALKAKGMDRACHAVESTSTPNVVTYLVCHGWTNKEPNRVCEIDVYGQILRQCGGENGQGPGQLSCPLRLVNGSGADAGDSRRKFLIDEERVLVLDERLQIQRLVLRRPPERERSWLTRWRLCYVRETGRLLVVWQDGHIHVHSVL